MDKMHMKLQPGGKGRIPYLVRAAWDSAKAGDREEALRIWNQAIAEGYQPRPFVERQFNLQIDDAEADNREFATKFARENRQPGEESCKLRPQGNS